MMLSISRNNKNDQAFCYPLLEISYSKLGDSAVLFIVLLMKSDPFSKTRLNYKLLFNTAFLTVHLKIMINVFQEEMY